MGTRYGSMQKKAYDMLLRREAYLPLERVRDKMKRWELDNRGLHPLLVGTPVRKGTPKWQAGHCRT